MLIGDRGGPRLRGRRVLVTGASGFIGRHLTARLVAGGAEVATLGRTAAGPQPLLPQHVADVGDSEAVMAALVASRPDVVVHLAGHVTGTRDASAVMPTAEANLIGTIHLLTAAVSSGLRPRIVLAGSMEEPDGAVGHAVPQSPYAAAKWASAGYVRMFEALYGLDVVHLRLFMTYGPGPQDERRLVPFVVRALLDGRRPQLSSGTRRVDWVYVGDVVDALVAAVVAERPGATPIDIGSGERESVRALVERIAKMLGRGDLVRFGEVEDRPMECEPQADLTMARLRLGWRPRTPLESGLEGGRRVEPQPGAKGIPLGMAHGSGRASDLRRAAARRPPNLGQAHPVGASRGAIPGEGVVVAQASRRTARLYSASIRGQTTSQWN